MIVTLGGNVKTNCPIYAESCKTSSYIKKRFGMIFVRDIGKRDFV